MASSSWSAHGPSATVLMPTAHLQRRSSEDRHAKAQTRQRLSCTKCRERKVKCDRTKPCGACCARGHPRDCEFIVGEGNDYGQIQQSYEIRKLRTEIQQLKEQLRAARLAQSGDEEVGDDIKDYETAKPTSRAAASRQRRFRMSERVDNLYFGTPGLARIVADFARLQMRELGTQSLVHPLPRGRQLCTPAEGNPAYPFPIFGQSNTSVRLARDLLSPRTEVLMYLDMFQRNAQSCSFPHVPDEHLKTQVERFLADVEGNAERFPDMLALIFAIVATGMQMGIYESHGGRWVEGEVKKSQLKSDVYLVASMEALRNASFLNSPTLLVIQTLILMGPYLTNSGRFLDAWTLFGLTIRAAHSIGLHRDPKVLEPLPSPRDSHIRRTLWWWMLHMDQQYSVTLGRPLGISGIGDCPPCEPLSISPAMLRLHDFIDHFTILARQVLSCDGMLSVHKIDDYTGKLRRLWDTMPEALQFSSAWLNDSHPLPEWPLDVMSATLFAKVQSYLVLLNRQRVEHTQAPTREPSPASSMRPSSRLGSVYGHAEDTNQYNVDRGRNMVVESCVAIAHTFLFLYRHNAAVLICWTVGQQAYNACMILLLDAWETGNEINLPFVEEAYAIFVELDKTGVHELAGLAVGCISTALLRIQDRKRDLAMSRSTSNSIDDQLRAALKIDTTAMPYYLDDAVMGNTGMFLLEDQGLQRHAVPGFQPLSWNMAGSTFSPVTSLATPSNVLSSTSHDVEVAISMLSSPFISPNTPAISPADYSMNGYPSQQLSNGEIIGGGTMQQDGFMPFNGHIPVHHQTQAQHDQHIARMRGARGPGLKRFNSVSNTAARLAHRVERSTKMQQQRRK